MFALPKVALPLFRSVAGLASCRRPSDFLTLMFGAILATGRRTITNLLRAVGGLAPGHPSSYHRVFSRRRWSLWPLAHGLADLVLRHSGPRGLRHAGRRRHRQRASRRPRLRQGAPPRPCSLDPQLHRLSLGPQVGRPGDLGPLPVRQPSLGPPRAGRAVSEPGLESAASATAQDPRSVAPPSGGRALALVPAPSFHADR